MGEVSVLPRSITLNSERKGAEVVGREALHQPAGRLLWFRVLSDEGCKTQKEFPLPAFPEFLDTLTRQCLSVTASCLTGLLRRILCSRSLPTHPSDQITETSSTVCDSRHQELVKSNEKLEATATTPGVVARLMGLEPLPETSLVDMKVSANSIPRSRSMNSVEFRGEGDQMQGEHRRAKSTLSFREMPTFLEVENEYLVLSFENIGSESKKVRSKERKWDVRSGELKAIRREKCKRKENRREKVVELDKRESEEKISKMVLRVLNEAGLSNRILEDNNLAQEVVCGGKIDDSPGPMNLKDCENLSLEDAKRSNWFYHKEVSDTGAESRKRNQKTKGCAFKNEEAEFNSQDSSPVSVLDFDQFTVDPEITTSEEDTKSGESNSRRKLSPQLDNQSHKHLSQRSDGNLIFDDRNSKKTEEPCPGSRKKVCHNHDYLSMWGEVGKLTETQVVETNWNIAHKNICKIEEDFEEISADFGLQILDQLLQELVDQLA
ncbi:unnamed protein product [Dovyalis caffra]|uniref:DUF3741 domain-containing protein n=1 Tax=Dovyalis caffra TaxID=77055 RepID=A0AAV1RDB6_9ROSI|nr:unnamed protein product [Dovyalis caffra]